MFEKDEGIRSRNQMQGIDPEGNLRNLRTTSDGSLIIIGGDGSTNSKTIMCDIAEIGTTPSTIEVGKRVTKLEIANYSETSKVTINVCDKIFKIGPSIAVNIVVNEAINNFTLTATEASEVQYLVEGEE